MPCEESCASVFSMNRYFSLMQKKPRDTYRKAFTLKLCQETTSTDSQHPPVEYQKSNLRLQEDDWHPGLHSHP